jgi:hypothetical protein
MANKNYKEQGLKLFKYITKERKDVGNIYFMLFSVVWFN